VQYQPLTGQILGTEDCLYLNVWRPASYQTRPPVYVWIHGGGNSTGSATYVKYYRGHRLAAAGNLVFVSVNYRLGPLGWFSHPALREGRSPEDDSGNFGTLDIIQALRWIRDNIAAFGGDPGTVLIAGESAGAMNVLSLLTCPAAAGLFHRAVIQSGVVSTTSPEQAEGRARRAILRLLEKNGLARDPRQAEELLASPERLRAFLRDCTGRQLLRCYSPGPSGMIDNPSIITDGTVLPDDGYAALERGDYPGKVPLIDFEAMVNTWELLASSPADTRAALDLLRLLFRRGEYREVVRRAEERLATAPRTQAAPAAGPTEATSRLITLYLKGLAEVALKRHGEAIESLGGISPPETAAAGLSVIDPYVLYYRAWASYRRGDLATARDQLFGLIDAYPSHALRQEAVYLAGWCLFSLSDHRRALAFFKDASAGVGPRAERATLLSGKSLAALGRLDEALAVFQALGRKPGELADDARLEAAAALAALGRVDEAASAYRDLAAAYPSSPLAEEALYRRGTLFREAGRQADAAAAFTDYRTRFPAGGQADGALYWGGLSSLENGHPFGAVLLWEILIDRHRASPYRPDAIRRTAAIYEQRSEAGRSLALLEKLAAEYPDEAADAREKARQLRLVLAGLGEREASLTVRIDREGGAGSAAGRAAMLELAVLYIHERNTKLEDAGRLLASVLASGDAALAARARYSLGELRDRKGEPVEAAREFLAAAVAAPDDADLAPSALYRAAEAMSRAGKREDARGLIERLERSFPGSPWTLEARRLQEASR